MKMVIAPKTSDDLIEICSIDLIVARSSLDYRLIAIDVVETTVNKVSILSCREHDALLQQLDALLLLFWRLLVWIAVSFREKVCQDLLKVHLCFFRTSEFSIGGLRQIVSAVARTLCLQSHPKQMKFHL